MLAISALAGLMTMFAPQASGATAPSATPLSGLIGTGLAADRGATSTDLRLRPQRITRRAATFALDDVSGRVVVSARLTAAGGRSHAVAATSVRRAAAGSRRLTLSLPRAWRSVHPARRLRITLHVGVQTDGVMARTARATPGTVVWKADAESPLQTEWASNSSLPVAASPAAPDPTRIAQDPFHAQGTQSYRFEMRDGDDSYGERAELGQAMPTSTGYENRVFRAGEDRWIAMQYYLPSDWSAADTWQTIMQIKPSSGGGGGPSIGFDAGRDRLMFYGNTNEWGSSAGNIFDGAGPLPGASYPITRGQWIKLTWHVVFSANPAQGSVEVFGDLADGNGMRTLVPRRRRATMKYLDGAMDPAHLRVGIYRDPAMTETESLYVDGVTVATTRELAEANAYGA
jgi:hypothetical protein